MSSAERVSSSRGRARGLPLAVLILDLLMLRGTLCDGSRRVESDGEAEGEVDIRSLSAGSSEAFRFRFDMVGVLKESITVPSMSEYIASLWFQRDVSRYEL